MSRSNLSPFQLVHVRTRNYFTEPLMLSSEARTPARVARGDIHSPLANGFHNDMRGKLGHLIILEGPPLARATVEPSLE